MTVESGGCGDDKPIDVGDGTICASFSASGAWLSLGAPHADHGFVELSNLPPFDETWRGDAAATRRYRRWMTEERFAFLVVRTADGPMPPLALDCSDPARPTWHGAAAGLEVRADARAETPGIVQRWRLRPTAAAPLVLEVVVSGRLDRPALAEITELDPPPATGALTKLWVEGARLSLRADALPAATSITVTADREVEWRLDGRRATASLSLDGELELNVACELSCAHRVAADAPAPASAADGAGLVARAVAYVRGCTALAVGEGQRTILTDHRILPLSWTRDAYYQALLLLARRDASDVARVADHLRWLWLRCERPDGRWVRSHHADGRRKDLAFQADQQLYPILELADFREAGGGLPELPGDRTWSPLVREAWEATLVERDSATGCLATAENAADDPAAAPFICASQILLWYAASRLAELSEAGLLELDTAELRRLAASVRQAVARHFVVDGPFGPQWAYAVDADGAVERYHDANDLPLALAPVWGFCSADDPVWRATMRYAFSPHNPGFFSGADYPGLGSLHTPGPWTLGDVQAWLFARLTDDAPAAAAAVHRLEAVAFGDGMLPEAYGADDPERRIRHWFAWPGAALGALLLIDARGELLARARTAGE